jgi:hypothetical protein
LLDKGKSQGLSLGLWEWAGLVVELKEDVQGVLVYVLAGDSIKAKWVCGEAQLEKKPFV